jgi:hypothetical protein
MQWRLFARAVRRLGALLLALELLYVVVANTILLSGVIQREASKPPENVNLAWSTAYSPWPGRAYVSGLRMRLQDGVQQFRLTVDHAKVDVVLWALLHREFRASHVTATGVSYRQVVKVDGTAGRELRLAAFPPLEGFSRPALRAATQAPPRTPDEIAALWRVELDDVDAVFSELWLLEYRYHGPGRIQGAFALAPLQSLWIGPALVQFDGGELSAGEHRIALAFTARLDLTLGHVDLPSSPGLRIFHTLSGTVAFDTMIEDLGAAALYVDGLGAQGTGRLIADLEIDGGRLTPHSSIGLSLSGSHVQLEGFDFTGDTHAKLWVTEDAQVPMARATLKGKLRVPLAKEFVDADLSDVAADLVLADNDLSSGFGLKWLQATLGEARVQDARPVTRKVGGIVPLAAKLVLGDGPLVASATARVTPGRALVRLERAKLGGAELEGAAVAGAHGWAGAAAGAFGAVPLGLRLKEGKLGAVPLVSPSWLGDELGKLGIGPEVAARVE